jgi:hypothetical protein
MAVADSADSGGTEVLPLNEEVLPLNHERIAGVIPDFQTVRESHGNVAPMTPRQKWNLAWRETVDPFNIGSAALGAAMSQMDHETPKYTGSMGFPKRFGAAQADFATQNFFSAGVFANLFHQDPRYFRQGPQSGIPGRAAYSLSRLLIARQDSGKWSINASNIFGMILGIVASNAYYPASSRTGSVMAARVGTSMMGGAIGNVLSEFWPDIQKKFWPKKHI